MSTQGGKKGGKKNKVQKADDTNAAAEPSQPETVTTKDSTQEQSASVTHWIYEPSNRAPLDIRAKPIIDGPRMRDRISTGDVFEVSEELQEDDVTFLKLADGRGWVFDHKPKCGPMCRRAKAEDIEAAAKRTNAKADAVDVAAESVEVEQVQAEQVQAEPKQESPKKEAPKEVPEEPKEATKFEQEAPKVEDDEKAAVKKATEATPKGSPRKKTQDSNEISELLLDGTPAEAPVPANAETQLAELLCAGVICLFIAHPLYWVCRLDICVQVSRVLTIVYVLIFACVGIWAQKIAKEKGTEPKDLAMKLGTDTLNTLQKVTGHAAEHIANSSIGKKGIAFMDTWAENTLSKAKEEEEGKTPAAAKARRLQNDKKKQVDSSKLGPIKKQVKIAETDDKSGCFCCAGR